jgi:glyoxylase-like metal-dependent hydrolase (beta-lactamase superfamily II)
MYVILGADGVTLVDPGWKSEPSEHALLAGLASLGAGTADVRQIVVTHAHWDHYTRAVDWQQRYGIPLLLGQGERHSIEVFDLSRGPYPRQAALLREAGAGEIAAAIDALELEDHERDMPFGAPDRWLRDGDRVDCSGLTLLAHATPGHTRGHIVYEDIGGGLLFTGDHLLPRITPSLAFEQAPEESPLTSYLASLRAFADGPDRRMLPAHGLADASAKDRARELLDHHDRRLKVVHDHVISGARTAFDVATRMRWTRHDKTLSQLGTVHAMTAVLEVRSHLEHLAQDGALARTGTATGLYSVN